MSWSTAYAQAFRDRRIERKRKMTETVPVNNETRQVRWVASTIAATTIALILTVGGCQMHYQTHPDDSRCLPGTIHVKVNDGWACAPKDGAR